MEQYTNFENAKHITKGIGIMKASNISSYYYTIDKSSKQIGCMNFSVKTKTASDVYLSGSFYEFDERKVDYNFTNYPDDYYKMYRISLPLSKKIRVKYFRNVFSCFEEVKKYINEN